MIDWKWETYCQTILIGEWLLFMLWLVSFAAFTILFQVRWYGSGIYYLFVWGSCGEVRKEAMIGCCL